MDKSQKPNRGSEPTVNVGPSGKLEMNEKTELESLIESDKQTIKSLEQELMIRQKEQQLLNVVSPSAGRVVNWNVKQNLTNRPGHSRSKLNDHCAARGRLGTGAAHARATFGSPVSSGQ